MGDERCGSAIGLRHGLRQIGLPCKIYIILRKLSQLDWLESEPKNVWYNSLN